MTRSAVRVKNLAEVQRAFKRVEGNLDKEVKEELREAADIVANEAQSTLAKHGGKTAGGIRGRVRGASRSVVEERYRKTTGKRPDWGRHVLEEHLEPALASKRDEVIARCDRMLDRLAGQF